MFSGFWIKNETYSLDEPIEIDYNPLTLTDTRDNKVYKIMEIGNQIWMAENLAYKPFLGNYWAYNNDFSNVSQYGYLYDWETACKVCPNGWHLPSDAEWTELTNYLGGVNIAGDKMKSTSGWDNNGNGSNTSQFSGLPGGLRYTNGVFLGIGLHGYWWTSMDGGTNLSRNRYLNYRENDAFNASNFDKITGLSVRCLKD